ncbi:outer membrane protein assembly factor BamA [Candidatus Parabeggiatoa sp. HSG14]|uniref:outer membrane protein assembly factor BamA n=1 Tax=Candidatus Parabeggiatoa sp. HSG14 TaxID=3055593 RepID=UPI0025A70562|nr:outer membrane protein assembly factor BamA [Thiotrichales bacterium HSG14]
MKFIRFIILGIVLNHSMADAFEAFVVEDIRLEGLRRISAGTVFNSLPVKPGENFSKDRGNAAISALFKTGFFKDIRLERKDNVLIVVVTERPAISKITFEGNTEMETEELTLALKNIGFAEGRVFNRSLLDKVTLELQRLYFNLGKYAVQIKSTVTPLRRNRVGIQIDISEGVVAKIHQITFVGNQAHGDNDLVDEMKLSTGGWFSFFTGDNQYSSLQLAADLEALRSFYLDRGFINFNIDSTQVSITPNKKKVYITINLTEGDKYTVSDIKLVGNLIVPKAELFDRMVIKAGNVFSRKKLSKSKEAISERIGDEGYAFANINAVPEIDSKNKTVFLNIFIDPGKRVYVRRINFKGNTKTRDEVLRREMRQMEGGFLSTKNIKRSQTRLERLNFFEEVTVETPRIPGTSDLVDLNYSVVERPSGNLLAGVGYSQTQKVVFNASIVQENFLGSGNRVGLTFNNSKVQTVYRFSYFNPYTTIDGVSRGFDIFYRTTDAEQANLSRYTMDRYGTTLNYGLPLTEFNFFNIGAAFDNTTLNTTLSSAKEVFDFIETNGNNYLSYRLTASLRHDTRNRALFPDRGMLQSLSAQVALPFSDISYYKISYRHQWLYPLIKDYILLFKGQVAYGDGYGNDKNLPFFENYTAGGPRTVRGFRENTLGPLDSNWRPLGGDLKVVGNVEVILPIPFTKNVRSFRLSTFVDVGNVYGTNENFDTNQLRYSTGLSAIWLSPLGILSFSLAKPLNNREGDQTEMFQFTIGTTFNW